MHFYMFYCSCRHVHVTCTYTVYTIVVCLQRLSDENLTSFCEEGIDLTEEAVAMETVEEAKQFLNTEISGLYKKILANLEESKEKFKGNFL